MLVSFLNALRWSKSLTGNQRVVTNRINDCQGDDISDIFMFSSILHRRTNSPCNNDQEGMRDCIAKYDSLRKNNRSDDIVHIVDKQWEGRVTKLYYKQPDT